ncbi:helix-turn-helix domain-containing protein [Lentzea sp. NBRC 102530]|uniref:winged helix-turn-helix transcriptional regulator n=1 Tax=Lentzea sp. NBRC 102530 TaxID=3032201 RepID=UPI0024A573E9|nr:helix-turn-helix domain-containing protein [Lentzea sp. NBRC 102530]GLY50233.1 ArsR family transcriptional regulator [Lentzea sp. NBRC 102530]
MALPSTYADRNCSLARALEIVGERWTLLIVRDAFFGVSRFGDFATQLGIPRAVLTNRLKFLVQEDVLAHVGGEYRLTAKGLRLWPVLRAMMAWGDAHYSPGGAKRTFRHEADGGTLDPQNRCSACGGVVPIAETSVEPGPGYTAPDTDPDPVSAVLTQPRRLLEPLT